MSAVVLPREHVAAEGRWIGEADPTDCDRQRPGSRQESRTRFGAYVAIVGSQVVGFVSVYDRHGWADLTCSLCAIIATKELDVGCSTRGVPERREGCVRVRGRAERRWRRLTFMRAHVL